MSCTAAFVKIVSKDISTHGAEDSRVHPIRAVMMGLAEEGGEVKIFSDIYLREGSYLPINTLRQIGQGVFCYDNPTREI